MTDTHLSHFSFLYLSSLLTILCGSSRPSDAKQVPEYLGGLIVWSEPDEKPSNRTTTACDKDEPRFRAVASIVNLGLSMLETEEGQANLTKIGNALIKSHRTNGKRYIYEGNPGQMAGWVGWFLTKLRSSFVPIVLTNHIGGEGALDRTDWAAGGLKMADWKPYEAGTLNLKKTVRKTP